ncbi:MAG: hypothetical protein ACXVCP_07400 [Bdellovibrio sp.]
MVFTVGVSGRMLTCFISSLLFLPIVLKAEIPVANPDPAISCIESTCGTANPLPHPFETSPDLAPQTFSLILSKMKKPVENYMGRLIHLAVLQDKAFKNVIQNAPAISLTPQQESFLQAARYLNRMSEFRSALETNKNGMSFNRKKLKTLLPKSSENELSAIVSLGKVIESSYYLYALSLMNYETVIQFLEPSYSLLEGQKRQADHIVFAESTIAQVIPLYTGIMTGSLVVQKALRGELLSVAEKKVMLKKITESYSLLSLFEKDIQQAFSKLPLNLTDALQEAQSRYQKSEAALAVQTPKTIKDILKKQAGQCFNKLTYSYAALPTKAQIEKFTNIMTEITNKARSLVEERKNVSLPDSLNGEIYLPTAREDVIDEWSNALAIGYEETQKQLLTLKSADLKDPANLQSVAIIFIIQQNHDLFEDVSSFCEKAEPGFLSDATNSANGTITLSWPTVVYPEMGATILAHEIGHVVSAIWPYMVKKEKNCLTAIQGTGKYAEEDFADLFSAEIYNSFSGKINDIKLSNLGCGVMHRYSGGWAETSFKNPYTSDVHSSAFYRLLATGTMTGTLKPECTEYLNKNKILNFNNYCRWQK